MLEILGMRTETQRRQTMDRRKVDCDWRLYEFSLEELGITYDPDPSFESLDTPAESNGDAKVSLPKRLKAEGGHEG